MAEGLLNSLSRSSYTAFSAGTAATGVNPHAIRAMQEMGIDISHVRDDIKEWIEIEFSRQPVQEG